jgi:hypothetical protein
MAMWERICFAYSRKEIERRLCGFGRSKVFENILGFLLFF